MKKADNGTAYFHLFTVDKRSCDVQADEKD